MRFLSSIVELVSAVWRSFATPFSKERFAAAAAALDEEASVRMARWGEPVCIALLSAAALGSIVAGVAAFRAQQLLDNGAFARALVETARVERRNTGKSGTYLVRVVTYRFTADDGALYQGNSEAIVERMPAVETGGEIEVRYAKGKPSRNVPETVVRGSMWDLVILMLMAAGFAAYFGLLSYRIHAWQRERATVAHRPRLNHS